MNHRISILIVFGMFISTSFAQNIELPTDYLTKEFHTERREALRKILPKNSVAVFFTNPVRNRANDVDFTFHQNPDFYYLTGYKEPNAVLLIFKDEQFLAVGSYNELIFVQENNELAELWNGKRLGINGVKELLAFEGVFSAKSFKNFELDFSVFDTVLFENFNNDIRDTESDSDLYDLIANFRVKINSKKRSFAIANTKSYGVYSRKIDPDALYGKMASLREIKTPEELVLLKKAIDISVIGQIEVMKAMHPNLSETEVQGIHEFVFKKYGAEYEGYPSIVGAGNNGCILHYTDNNKPVIGDKSLILMDLGAEYHGYTADITRTIPTNGKFTNEQKQIYNLVLEAQEAGIAEMKIGNNLTHPNNAAKAIINKGLANLKIIATKNEAHSYLPHGVSHHIGLDVHDSTNFGDFKENMVLTVEPGIYIPEGSKCDKKWWGIAVRIEDNILITKNGPVNLSIKAPRTIEDIEKTMELPSALDNFILPKLD